MGAIFILAAAGASLALASSIPLPPWVRMFTILWIAAAALDAYRGVGSRRAGREIALREGVVEVTDAAGNRVEGSLRQGCFVSPWLTTIRWRPSGKRFDRTILVLPDMLAGESFRELRVWLRVG